MEFGTTGGFDFTQELKEMLRKKMGFAANGGFGCTQEKLELIVKNYKKKKWFGLNGGFDFIQEQKKKVGVWSQWWI